MNLYQKLAIWIALRKPAPEEIQTRFSDSADENFYTLHIVIPSRNIRLLCKEKSKSHYKGVLWEVGENGTEGSIPKTDLEDLGFTLNIVHYYKGSIFSYDSPKEFVRQTIVRGPETHYAKNVREQALFNNTQIVRSDRIKVLEHVLNKTYQQTNYTTDALSLSSELHSIRWHAHPDKDILPRHYELVLDSLEASKDLIKVGHVYNISPKAMATLSEYARDEEKHNDSEVSANKTRSLTKAIIILGLVNLSFQLVKWAYELGAAAGIPFLTY